MIRMGIILSLFLVASFSLAQAVPVLSEFKTFKEIGDAIEENGWFLGLAFSPDGKNIAVSTHTGYLLVWDLAEGKKVLTKKLTKSRHLSLKSLLFTPDSKKLVFRKDEKQISFWNLELNQEVQTLQFPHPSLSNIKITKDGKFLVAVGLGEFTTESKFVSWNLETGNKVLEIVSKKVISDISISPDGTKLACSCTNGVPIFNLVTGEEIERFQDKDSAKAVSFSDDGKFLAFVTSPTHESSVINLYDMESKKSVGLLTGLPSKIKQVVFSPDGTLIATRTDRYFYVYNIASNKYAKIEMRDLEAVAFSIDSKFVAAIGKIDKKPCAVLWGIEIK